MISVIIPVYNEEKLIRKALDDLSGRDNIEVIVADGQSTDRTLEYLREYPVKIIHCLKNRARQMNEAAKIAQADILLFLHADCILEEESLGAIEECIKDGHIGGCLSQRIEKEGVVFRFLESFGNIRAKLAKVFYGDQAIFVKKDIFLRMAGFPEVPMMEDVFFTKKLRRIGKTEVLSNKVFVSPRRWQKRGLLKTTFLYSSFNILTTLRVPLGKIKLLYDDLR